MILTPIELRRAHTATRGLLERTQLPRVPFGPEPSLEGDEECCRPVAVTLEPLATRATLPRPLHALPATASAAAVRHARRRLRVLPPPVLPPLGIRSVLGCLGAARSTELEQSHQ